MITALIDKLKLDKKKILFIALVAAAILYLDFTLLIKLQFNDLKDISPKIVKLKKDIKNLSKDLATMQDFHDKQGKMKQTTASSVKRILTEERIPLLLQHISDIANKNNISIMQIRPSRELRAGEEKISGNTIKFSLVLTTLDLSCSYHNLGKFINDLENLEEFIALQELKITPSSGDYLRQNVSLVLKTYVRK